MINRRQLLFTAAAGQGLLAEELSTSVAIVAQQSLIQATKEAKAHRLRAHSLRKVHTSMEIAFGNLDETGYTQHLNRRIRAAGVADSPLDYLQLTLLRQTYTNKTGELVPEDKFQALVQNNYSMWPKFHQLMLRGGDKAVRSMFLLGLERGADKLEREELIGSNSGILRLVDNLEPPDVSGMSSWDICAALGLGGVYVSTWGLMDAIGAVSAFAFGPIAWALIGLFLAVAGVVCL